MNGNALNGDALNGNALHGRVPNGASVASDAALLPMLTPMAEMTADAAMPSPENQSPQISEPWPELEHDELETERAGLEAEIAAARARTAVAKHRAAQRDAEMRAALRVELEASKDALADMEREHAVAVALVREAADVEVAEILAAARRQVAASVVIEPRVGELSHDAD